MSLSYVYYRTEWHPFTSGIKNNDTTSKMSELMTKFSWIAERKINLRTRTDISRNQVNISVQTDALLVSITNRQRENARMTPLLDHAAYQLLKIKEHTMRMPKKYWSFRNLKGRKCHVLMACPDWTLEAQRANPKKVATAVFSRNCLSLTCIRVCDPGYHLALSLLNQSMCSTRPVSHWIRCGKKENCLHWKKYLFQ